MSTNDEQFAAAEDRVTADQRRLDAVGERVAEARQAADQVAARENVSDQDRQAAADSALEEGPQDSPGSGRAEEPGEGVAGRPTGSGAPTAPG